MICTNCFYSGKPKTVAAGSAIVELALYVFTIPLLCIPGLFYSHWRTKNATKICKECGGSMISEESPRGKEIITRLGKVSK